jgi:hypothetical protein
MNGLLSKNKILSLPGRKVSLVRYLADNSNLSIWCCSHKCTKGEGLDVEALAHLLTLFGKQVNSPGNKICIHKLQQHRVTQSSLAKAADRRACMLGGRVYVHKQKLVHPLCVPQCLYETRSLEFRVSLSILSLKSLNEACNIWISRRKNRLPGNAVSCSSVSVVAVVAAAATAAPQP